MNHEFGSPLLVGPLPNLELGELTFVDKRLDTDNRSGYFRLSCTIEN